MDDRHGGTDGLRGSRKGPHICQHTHQETCCMWYDDRGAVVSGAVHYTDTYIIL